MNFEVSGVQFLLLHEATLQAFSETHFIGCIKGEEAVFTFRPDEASMDWSSRVVESPRVR